MIKRINALKGVGRFSTLHSSNGDEGLFLKLNIIYASNACGKSTLCDIFRSLDTGNPTYIIGRKRLGSDAQPEIIISFEDGQTACFRNNQWNNCDICQSIYIYDDRFITENILIGHHIGIDQRRNLYGLVIGEQTIALKSAVDAAEQRLNHSTFEFNNVRENLTRLIPMGYNIDSFKELSIVDNVDGEIEYVKSKLRTIEQTNARAGSIRLRMPMTALPIPEVPDTLDFVLSSTLNTAALAAEAKIKEHLVATSQRLPISWVKKGFESQIGTICPHCGQDMHGLEILEAYRVFFSGELQDQEQLRESLNSSVKGAFGDTAQNTIQRILIAHKVEQDWWKDVAGYEFVLPQIGDVETILAMLRDIYQAIGSALERKRENPGNKICLNDEETAAITLWNENIVKLKAYNKSLLAINDELLIRQKNAGIVDIAPLQQKLSGLTASKKRYEQDVVKAYAAYDAGFSEKSMAQQDKQRANDALREQSNLLFGRYGERINELLSLFGADFRIVSDGVFFRGGQPAAELAIELQGTKISVTPDAASDPSQPSLANTLSGGDRSALAFAYFLARVEMASDVDSSIIVFDDPYHNQDRSRRQCTIERIHHLTDLSSQCFVFSHDLEFARAVEKCPNARTKTFVLNPLTDSVTLTAQPLPLLPSQAYEKNYQRLDNFLKEPCNCLQHLSEIASTIRVILEEYLRHKFPKSWAESDSLGEMIRKIREARVEDPLSHCEALIGELSDIHTFCKRFHHGASGETADEPDPRELKVYVERTLSVIHAGGKT